MEAGATGAYGVALAGGGFDPVSFLKRPQTVVRILGWVAAMVVFACITGEGYVNSLHDPQARCVFNKSDSACHYAVGVGIIAFLACMAFLLADAYMPFMSNAQDRKKIVAADLIFSGVWTFLWFVCFCLLANLWSKTTDTNGIPADAVHATVAFSFFSIAAFGALTYFSLMRFRQGVEDVPQTFPPPASDQPSPYPSYPSSYAPYPGPGLDGAPQPQGESGYLPPAY
ncbi:synaptogyrin-2b [Denticeps clupeoides]|uniref:Synaptogyrin n=1 Tax=Denticeps clupeoides TaxID=299321 RepID=A0AAY3ZV78_9TELE|nr:synaptogyrin-2-like [Denticeps clupeoides]